jgi:predicted Zn finger-like uncharacterized protein
MLIVCPSCATSYQVDPSSLGTAGRAVRCVRCRNTWFAANPDAMAAIAQAHREDVATLAATWPNGAQPDPPPPAGAGAPPIVEAAPPLVPEQPTPEADARPEAAPGEPPLRDDRGPAARREPPADPRPKPSQPVASDPAPGAAESGAVEPPTGEPATAVPAAAEPATAVPAAAPGGAVSVPEDIESVAARRLRRKAQRQMRRRRPLLTAAIMVLLTINGGLIAWRNEVVQWSPQTASLYAAIRIPVNLRGLVFTDIVTHTETQDGVKVLLIDGVIKSQSRRVAEVPRLRFAVRNAAGQEIYNWTALPARNAIAPGTSMPFRSRLASPPPETRAVLVRFFNRRDLIAGIK